MYRMHETSAQLIARWLVLDFFYLAINVDRAPRVLQNGILTRLDFLRLALDVRAQSPPTARAPPSPTRHSASTTAREQSASAIDFVKFQENKNRALNQSRHLPKRFE